MSRYNELVDKAVNAIVARFAKKNIANLFAGRGGKLLGTAKQVQSATGFDLITWLVIKG